MNLSKKKILAARLAAAFLLATAVVTSWLTRTKDDEPSRDLLVEEKVTISQQDCNRSFFHYRAHLYHAACSLPFSGPSGADCNCQRPGLARSQPQQYSRYAVSEP
jgi:hypothetical protein